MKFFLFFLFFIVIFSISVSATSLGSSPGSLVYEMKPNEVVCKEINIYSENYTGKINSELKWSGKNNFIENPNDFKFSAEDLNLIVSYPKTIENFDKDTNIEVCIIGSDIGIYRGSLAYYAIEEGNNIGVGAGTWLKVTIGETSQQSSSSSSTSSGGSSTSSASQTKPQNTTTNEQQNQTISENKEKKSDGITGGAIGASIMKNKTIIIIFIICLIIIAAFIFMKKKKGRENFNNYGYK